uniref:Uncharacterized protein n=1 Tax=Gasterosteus aculeatus aculeatus TaxID=481459 RepID=A0AAQ4RSR5_GASAC
GAVRLRGPTLRPVDPLSGSTCRSGFYAEEELRPHLRRPRQDPRAPGAGGKPFPQQRLTPRELSEELAGFHKNQLNQFASNRISLHRELGEDTWHPDCLAQRFPRCPGPPDHQRDRGVSQRGPVRLAEDGLQCAAHGSCGPAHGDPAGGRRQHGRTCSETSLNVGNSGRD